jgi:hypothetical protein
MTPIRVRGLERVRVGHECVDCARDIPRGDPCVEVSLYESRRVWSEYTCCRAAHQVRKARRWWVAV